MYVEELVIDGFKSYAVRTVITGWDRQFNAITGLNGSGKSNILDAVCFVLGINNTSNLRAQNLQDLIYKRGQAGVTKASVTITFDNTDKSKSPIGFDQYPKISVTRQILLGGNSKYLINGHKAQQVQVLNLFQSVQLNINHPNFLIMQGKITKMLNMKPKEILGLIEEAAGTKVYEWQREKAEKTMKKKNLKLETTENLLKEEVEPKLRHLHEQKRIVLEYQDIQTELETLMKAVAAHDYMLYTKKLEEAKQSLLLSESHRKNQLANIDELEKEIRNLQNDLEEIKQKKAGRERETALGRIDKLKTDIESNKGNHDKLESDYHNFKDELEHKKQALQRNEDLFSTLSTGISTEGSTTGGYLANLQNVKKKLSDTMVEIQKCNMQISHLTTELEVGRTKEKSKKADLLKIDSDIARYKQNLDGLKLKLSQIGFDPSKYLELQRKEKDAFEVLNQLKARFQNFRRQNPQFDFTYEPPCSNFDPKSVKGLAGELFSLPENNASAATALEVCAGRRLFNVVVDNQVVGAQLLEHGKLRRRVTLIPLNKIRARITERSKVQMAKQIGPHNVDLALDLIEYDDDSKKAMEYIFGNKLICQDPETAKNVTFNHQVHTGSVTLDGDYYDPEGRLSGGSRKGGSFTLKKFMEFRRIRQKIGVLTQQLSEIQIQLKQLSVLSNQTQPIQHSLQVTQYQIDVLEKNSLMQTTDEIRNLHEKVDKLRIEAQTYKVDIKRIEKDMQEFNSDSVKKLQELKENIKAMNIEVKNDDKRLQQIQKMYQESDISTDQIKLDIHSLEESIKSIDGQCLQSTNKIKVITLDIDEQQKKLVKKRSLIDEQKSKLAGINEEFNEVTSVLNKKRTALNDANLKKAKISQEVEHAESKLRAIKTYLESVIEEHDWVQNDKIRESVLETYPNIDLSDCHQRIKQLGLRVNAMKKKGVNMNIMSQIEQHEKHETSLKTKIKQINRDKKKIEETIAKLDNYKRAELIKTYKKVSKDFGEIFSVLLPHSFAKLVSLDKDDVTKGLEVKVQLGNVWKDSLVELSGGQRSLAALSLIMSLLQFRPAPLYILDEVDAALDLNHTQSIGHLIKTRFKGSQFMVVSLKEGMFTNANRLFRVRFQEGTSVVTAM
ncbi:hypothetical protein HII12_003821 [Brettanomyces bruxellensis]|uniref:SMC hinge domain-containing protein n=1 Tax=Dekkera bruxellensis TaxID=5007 RepID=A0A8H6BCG5_DEKBR|nr:hypothetical protein HII12_003821 [Brettanomyces bruxellensis]